MKYSKLFVLAVLLSFYKVVSAHPIGNIITIGDHVLWSYVSPVGDKEHHACIMIWDQKTNPKPFIVSEHSASDYTLYVKEETIYIIESKYDNKSNTFESRVLKTTINEKPMEIWPWFIDKWKIGSNGFFMNSDTQIVFGNYPHIYCLDKDGQAEVYFSSIHPINKIKPVNEDKILLLSEDICQLTNNAGIVLKSWNNLIDKRIIDAPLNRNNVYDVAYNNGDLLIAYWGKRSFELINSDGVKKVLKQCTANWVPHWVAYIDNKPLLFSSNLDFKNPFTKDGAKSTIVPEFELYDNGDFIKIWHSN